MTPGAGLRTAAASPRAFAPSLEESPDLDGTTVEALTAFTVEQGAAAASAVA